MALEEAGRRDGQGFDLVAALWALAPEFAAYVAAQAALFVPCLILVRRHRPQHKDPWELADLLFSAAVFPVMTWSAMAGSWRLRSDVSLRWRGVTPESQFFMMLYTTRALLHCFLQCKMRMSWSHFVLMTLHHVLSMLCYGSGLVLRAMHFWACLDGCCEMSTVFLNNMYLFKEIKLGGRELRQAMPSWVYAANGFCLWLSFLVFRIVLFPLWLYMWYRDVSTSPEATWDRSTHIERYGYPGVTVFLFLLSVYWFVPVTKGMLKALGLAGKKDSGKSPKDE